MRSNDLLKPSKPHVPVYLTFGVKDNMFAAVTLQLVVAGKTDIFRLKSWQVWPFYAKILSDKPRHLSRIALT